MNEDSKKWAEETVEKIKELVRMGNVSRILVKREENTILNIPLNAGIAGTVLGLTAAPWALIASAIATLGFDCKVEILKTDGETVDVLSREIGKKAVDYGTAVVNEVKDSFRKD